MGAGNGHAAPSWRRAEVVEDCCGRGGAGLAASIRQATLRTFIVGAKAPAPHSAGAGAAAGPVPLPHAAKFGMAFEGEGAAFAEEVADWFMRGAQVPAAFGAQAVEPFHAGVGAGFQAGFHAGFGLDWDAALQCCAFAKTGFQFTGFQFIGFQFIGFQFMWFQP